MLNTEDTNISSQDYSAFCQFLERSCGIVLGRNKHYLVNSRLKRVLEEHHIESIGKLLTKIGSDTGGQLYSQVIDAMTTNETYWFRDNHPFKALKEHIFPALIERKITRPRIWSAACSTGQEAYTISMTVDEFLTARRGVFHDVEIVCTDISPSVLQIAKAAKYDELSLSRGLTIEHRNRYFIQEDTGWRIKENIRSRARFSEINLKNSVSTRPLHIQ